LTSEAVWVSFGAGGVYSYPDLVGSDIDDSGNAALMLVYENQLVGGLGNAAAGVESIAPRATKPMVIASEGWDVTVANGRAITALMTSSGTSVIEELGSGGFTQVAASPDTDAPDSAFVVVAGSAVPAMVGTAAGESAFRTNLPRKVRRC